MHHKLLNEVQFVYEHPDSQIEISGWDVRWSGWRTPVNGFFEFGFWYAVRHHNLGGGQTIMYSTVGGVCDVTNDDAQPIDMRILDEVRRSYPNWLMLTKIDKEKLAYDAIERLLARIHRAS